ncbi:hypothetical protein C0991_008782 [Blastosporella zonata]|nr:hypothetical protein C0991_008782 [Blastosporella zonata]
MFNFLARAARSRSCFSAVPGRTIHLAQRQRPNLLHHRLLWGSAAVAISTTALLGFGHTIYLDAGVVDPVAQDSVVDPATSIEFPTTIRIPSKIKIPTMTLVGLGVRTVSFLGIKVYSVAFYADLDNPKLKVCGYQ